MQQDALPPGALYLVLACTSHPWPDTLHGCLPHLSRSDITKQAASQLQQASLALSNSALEPLSSLSVPSLLQRPDTLRHSHHAGFHLMHLGVNFQKVKHR